MIVPPPAPETLLRAVRSLPSAPQILARASQMLGDPNTDVRPLAELLKRDASLTACIVRIGNSAIYGHAEPCGSLEEAVARLGFAELYRLVGFATAAQICPQILSLYGVTGAQFRENALLTALVMEQLAPAANLPASAAYTAGLLRSIGKIALDRLVAANGHGLDYSENGRGPLAEWEVAAVGMDNCAAAAIILAEWQFPQPIVLAIRDHYARAGGSRLAHLLNVAAGAAERCGHGWPGERAYWDYPEKCTAAGVDENFVDEATREALQLFGPVRAAVA
jgi:HD-like signal output (HDOD) protein